MVKHTPTYQVLIFLGLKIALFVYEKIFRPLPKDAVKNNFSNLSPQTAKRFRLHSYVEERGTAIMLVYANTPFQQGLPESNPSAG